MVKFVLWDTKQPEAQVVTKTITGRDREDPGHIMLSLIPPRPETPYVPDRVMGLAGLVPGFAIPDRGSVKKSIWFTIKGRHYMVLGWHPPKAAKICCFNAGNAGDLENYIPDDPDIPLVQDFTGLGGAPGIQTGVRIDFAEEDELLLHKELSVQGRIRSLYGQLPGILIFRLKSATDCQPVDMTDEDLEVCRRARCVLNSEVPPVPASPAAAASPSVAAAAAALSPTAGSASMDGYTPPSSGEKVRGICANCGEKGKKRCEACNSVWYCGGDCQKVHWKAGHRQECKTASPRT